MPVPAQEIIARPRVSPLQVALEPAYNALQSLYVVTEVEELSGLAEWVYDTYQALEPELRRRHKMVMVGLHYAIMPRRSWSSFPEYINRLTGLAPEVLRDRLLDAYLNKSCESCPLPIAPEDREEVIRQALSSEQAYIDFLHERFNTDCVDDTIEGDAYHYVIDPPALQRLVVSHLRMMWDRYLVAEWQKSRPMLERTVSALKTVDLEGMERIEAMKLVTGHDLVDEKWEKKLKTAERILLIPNPHLGPYLGHLHAGSTHLIFFGARLPVGLASSAPELNRNEILIRVNALDDDTRLSILELIGREGEMRSQEVMQALELSQSAASRHLKQLVATGYLSERWVDGAKSYTINQERLEGTLAAIRSFVLGNTGG